MRMGCKGRKDKELCKGWGGFFEEKSEGLGEGIEIQGEKVGWVEGLMVV